MNNKVIFEAINSGPRDGSIGWCRQLTLLYEDGTWERIFESKCSSNIGSIGTGHLKGKTREFAINKLEKLCLDGILEGKFLV